MQKEQEAKPRYMGRSHSEGAFVFQMGLQSPSNPDPAAFLASLGISKAESGRIRAQGRISFNPDAGTFALVPRRDSDPAGQDCSAQTRPVVLYEDDFCLAVDKPAGILVHGDGTGATTLSHQVEAYLAQKGDLLAPQAVQRLDVETTGIVLFSKAVEFQGLFDALVADHSLMAKRYLAVVCGAYPVSHDRLSYQIARDRHDARRMRACSSGGQDALSLVERLAVAPDSSASLLRVTLMTGRKHQIRVHLAARGFPVAGDPLYGSRNNLGAGFASEGLMLHAAQEELVHPVTGERVSIQSPAPQRIARLFPDAATARM